MFRHYRKLIRLRHEHPTSWLGDFELLLADHDQLWAFTRTLADQELLVLANCSSEVATVAAGSLPDQGGGPMLLQTHRGRPLGGSADELALHPGSRGST